jgi:hypothetical protein
VVKKRKRGAAGSAVVAQARQIARDRLALGLSADKAIELERQWRATVTEDLLSSAREDAEYLETLNLSDLETLPPDYRMAIDAAHRAIAADLIERGERLSGALQKLVVELLRTPLPPSSIATYRKGQHSLNLIIWFTIENICEATNLPATRNRQQRSDKPSACSIVAEALAEGKTGCISEAAVEKIWEKFNKDINTKEFL